MTESQSTSPITASWVDDHGSKTAIVEIEGEKRLIYQDDNGHWRNICAAGSEDELYHAELINAGHENGRCQIILPSMADSKFRKGNWDGKTYPRVPRHES